jgi:hypothetical protein
LVADKTSLGHDAPAIALAPARAPYFNKSLRLIPLGNTDINPPFFEWR